MPCLYLCFLLLACLSCRYLVPFLSVSFFLFVCLPPLCPSVVSASLCLYQSISVCLSICSTLFSASSFPLPRLPLLSPPSVCISVCLTICVDNNNVSQSVYLHCILPLSSVIPLFSPMNASLPFDFLPRLFICQFPYKYCIWPLLSPPLHISQCVLSSLSTIVSAYSCLSLLFFFISISLPCFFLSLSLSHHSPIARVIQQRRRHLLGFFACCLSRCCCGHGHHTS